MNCPKCGAENMSKVVDIRNKGDRGTYRRRECTICGYRFSSMEVVVQTEKGKTAKLPKSRKKAEHGASG